MNHQLTLYQLKSSLFDLCSVPASDQSVERKFDLLKQRFADLFHLKRVDLLLFGSNRAQVARGLLDEPLPLSSTEMLAPSDFDMEEEISERGHGFADDYLIFRDQNMEPLGAFLFKATDEWHAFAATSYLRELKETISKFLHQTLECFALIERETNYRKLFVVTELFNSTMDGDVVLGGAIQELKNSFPGFEVSLILSHERKGKAVTYRLFDYLNERASAVDAFLSGELTVEQESESPASILNAPIKGRQGIYGVLQIVGGGKTEFTPMQRNFIRMIANAAGNGLENASLYDQSHRLVEDLQLVNEVSKKLNSNMEMNEMVQFLKGQFDKAFHPSEIGLAFYEEAATPRIYASSDFFSSEEGWQYIEIASSRLLSGSDAVFEANLHHAIRGAGPLRYKSLASIPILHQGEMIGFIILLGEDEYYFSFESFKLMRSLIAHSSLAMSNSLLRRKMQELVDLDNLTKLYTRRYLDAYIQKSMENDEAGVFILLDVDSFKQVNDTLGHTVGDDVLVQLSNVIMREVDGTGVAGRWGGEEIAVFLPAICKEKGIAFAEKLVARIPEVTDPRVTVSAGLHGWDQATTMSFKELFQCADKALYEAKRTGKDRLVVFDESAVST